MKTQVSALLDGELESHELPATFEALRNDPELRGVWCDYRTIGESLRGEAPLAGDITARVMADLRLEPTVLAPRRQSSQAWQRPLMALAASAAGVAVVAWVAFAPQASHLPAAQSSLARVEPAAVKPVASRQMQEYLVAHQAHSSSLQAYAGAQQVRTVSVAGR